MSKENSSNYITINREARRLRDSLRMGRHPRDKRRQKHCEVVTAFDVKGLRQNRLLQEGKQSRMTEDRTSLLESIGFVWELLSKDTWMKHFQELKKYAAKEGHCNVPYNYSENKQLGMWVNTQRSQKRLLREGKKSTMTEDRKSLLESIGFVWELRSKSTWTQITFD